MTHDDEEARMLEIYRGYAADPAVQRRWGDTPGNRLMLEERERVAVQLLASAGMLPWHGGRVLEVGCGGGRNLAFLAGLGIPAEQLFGVDLVPERVTQARALLPRAQVECGNGATLAHPTGHFQLVLLYTVLSSVLDAGIRQQLAAEVHRVLAPGGALLWYDMRIDNPRNRQIVGISRAELRRLFPGYGDDSLRSITLMPPVARAVGRWSPWLYSVLAATPPLRSHYMGLLRRPVTDVAAP